MDGPLGSKSWQIGLYVEDGSAVDGVEFAVMFAGHQDWSFLVAFERASGFIETT